MKRTLMLFVICSCVALLLLFVSAITANAAERPVRIRVIWEEDPELFFQARCTIEDKYHNDVVLDEVELFNESLSEHPYWLEDAEEYYFKTFEYNLDDTDMLTFQVEASDAVDFGILVSYDDKLFGFDCRTYGYCYIAFEEVAVW